MGFFNLEKKQIVEGAFETIMGEKALFKGELHSSGAVCLNGRFEGKLSAEGELLIAQGSKLAGEVKGGTIIVSGTVDGNITALQSLEITKSGRVHGDLTGGKIVIEEGSSYRGKVTVTGEESEPEVIIPVNEPPAEAPIESPQMF